jgi:membrane protein DedA with SNARE-associated domain
MSISRLIDKGGYRMAGAYGPEIRLDVRKLKIARYLFDTYGSKVVLFGRITALLHTYAAFLARASRMSWRHFLPANAAGGIVWARACTIAAHAAGDTLRRLSGTISLILTVAGGLAIVAARLFIRCQMRKLGPRGKGRLPRPTPTRPTLMALTCDSPSVPLCEFWSSRTRCALRPC